MLIASEWADADDILHQPYPESFVIQSLRAAAARESMAELAEPSPMTAQERLSAIAEALKA